MAARVVFLVLAGWCVMGCGGKEEIITIPPFEFPEVDIVVNSPYPVRVALNKPAPQETFVDVAVEPAYQKSITIDKRRLTYAKGVQDQNLRITGTEPTDDYAEISFVVVDGDSTQYLRVKVNPQGQP